MQLGLCFLWLQKFPTNYRQIFSRRKRKAQHSIQRYLLLPQLCVANRLRCWEAHGQRIDSLRSWFSSSFSRVGSICEKLCIYQVTAARFAPDAWLGTNHLSHLRPHPRAASYLSDGLSLSRGAEFWFVYYPGFFKLLSDLAAFASYFSSYRLYVSCWKQ